MVAAPLLSALLAIAPVAATAPPAATEPEVWGLAVKVNSPSAYEVYLERFPQGQHHEAAVEAYYRLQGRPVLFVPPPQSPSPPPPVVTVAPPSPDPCDTLPFAPAPSESVSEQARVFKEARQSNRPADFQAYLAGFPNGACRARATRILDARKARGLRFKPVPGLGPLAPHRLNPPWDRKSVSDTNFCGHPF
jgi:hypothetical protein